jgi:hypothetical protein
MFRSMKYAVYLTEMLYRQKSEKRDHSVRFSANISWAVRGGSPSSRYHLQQSRIKPLRLFSK